MKVPANITADRLMLEYLARVADAGTRYLPKGDRMAFVSTTRRRIERECGTGLGDPECMRGVLAQLGEPEQLVRAERARIDAARVRRKAPADQAGAAAEPVTAPLRHRRISSRWRPATQAWPGTRQGPPPPGEPAAPGEPLEGKVLPPAERASHPEPGGPVGSGKAAQAATPPPGWRAVPVRVPPRPVAERGAVATALATAGHAVTRLASAGVAAARRYPLEATAVIVLGLGGLILPFPLWLVGAAISVRSRIWDPIDKWAAFLGPLLFALVGSIVTASVIHAQGNAVMIYAHAVRVDFGDLLRAGSVLCAVFLAVRARHGPRERIPRWQQPREQVPPWRR